MTSSATATTAIVQLRTRNTAVTPEDMLAQFLPPPRFAKTRFANYNPNPGFPSQHAARARLEQFVQEPHGQASGGLFGFFKRAATKNTTTQTSLYLDGGFGVGKTHLLAATWHECTGAKFFLSFAELTFAIGAFGLTKALEAFGKATLLCIDEFELDDVGNTLMVARFLAELLPKGTRVVATSNTLPNQLGEGRFNAEDFKREIQSIATHFETMRIDGPDYRHREGLTAPTLLHENELLARFETHPGPKALEGFAGLLQHLASLHPIRYAKMLEGLGAVFVQGLQPMPLQDDALRFVHFVDKLYDREVAFAASGCDLQDLFPDTYRYGGYAKKYARCLSRLGEMLREGA